MLFIYKVIDNNGRMSDGTIDAVSIDVAISSLQRRNFIISSIKPAESHSIFDRKLTLFERVKTKDVVVLSRQMATLFEAQISALRAFRFLVAETESPALRTSLLEIADDLQGGSSISKALSKHPKVFSDFYVNMVKAGEESGKLDETFLYLADYLDRNYELTSKAANALIYPAFIVFTFISVMVLMMVMVIPSLSAILLESGQEIPIYTKIVIALSNFMVSYGIFVLVALVIGGFFIWRFGSTKNGKYYFARMKITMPYFGGLFRKLYLSRLADNLSTMLSAAIPIVKALEITAAVVDNAVYEKIFLEAAEGVKSGSSISDSFSRYKEVPGIVVHMIKVGEETGEMVKILKTLSAFYRREVVGAVDSLVSLIEPVMVVGLGLGVGFLLTAVLMPIYNIAGGQ
ncbi:MAG: type II secretion system F family protein [Candidatus Paceibacterota bacterium]